MKYSSECERIAYSEEYFDILVEAQDIEEVIEQFNPKCYIRVDNIYVIVRVSVEEFGNIIQNLRASDYPIIYGPYANAEANVATKNILYHPLPEMNLRGEGVLIGIIDSGIDYTHKVFMNEDGTTKITRIWDQTIPGNPPEGFDFGTEYTMEDINKALQSDTPYETVPSTDESGHGTFLAGVASGREVIEENFIGVAPDTELVIVKLKEAKKIIKELFFVEGINQVYEDSDIILGINYVQRVARGLNKPLAISLGIGSNLGSHDGTSKLEYYLLNFAKTKGQVITVPAGNEAIAGHHYRGEIDQEETYKDVEVNVADGEEGIYLSIWCHSPDKISVGITSPLGGHIPRIPIKFAYARDIRLALEETTISIIYEVSEDLTGEQFIFIRMSNPTPGIWTIRVFGDIVVTGRFDIWLPRVGWVKEETRFLQADPFTTVTLPGTALNTFTIGGYDQRTGSIYKASGRGLVWDYELKPDIVAPSVDVYGPLPGNRFGTMTGTSIGSAITGGVSALLLEWGIILGNEPNMNTFIARHYLIRGAKRKVDLIYPNRIWGYGQLDLLGTFETLKGIRLK